MQTRGPSIEQALQLLPNALKLLTDISLQSMAELVPDMPGTDEIMQAHMQRLSAVTAQIQLDADKLNPRWNKSYGDGATFWKGALQDGVSRGGVPYFCPSGWVRFALNVCEDHEFKSRFEDWCILYHGTKGKFVGSILTSGFRASKGLCHCGQEDHAVYMSPSIEYCGHPRYGSIEYVPETRQWVQVVLQCRVNPKMVWKKVCETMACKRFNKRVDPNFSNEEMEWLFKPNSVDDATGDRFIKDAIVCTGIMMRVTSQHPLELPLWWTGDDRYTEHWHLLKFKLDPCQRICQTMKGCEAHGWKKFSVAHKFDFPDATVCEASLCVVNGEGRRERLHDVWLAPFPFAQGHMRVAWYLWTSDGLYVVKRYNQETLRFIEDGLQTDEKSMIVRDAATYVVAQHFARKWNTEFVPKLRIASGTAADFTVNFLKPYAFHLVGSSEWFFGERLITGGDFVKWNTNAGQNNFSEAARGQGAHLIADAFSHFSWASSKGRLMLVDLQGWDLINQPGLTLTDPQVHTRRFDSSSRSRKDDALYKQFSVGNLGRTGMLRFFANHKCHPGSCGILNLSNPLHRCPSFSFTPAARNCGGA